MIEVDIHPDLITELMTTGRAVGYHRITKGLPDGAELMTASVIDRMGHKTLVLVFDDGVPLPADDPQPPRLCIEIERLGIATWRSEDDLTDAELLERRNQERAERLRALLTERDQLRADTAQQAADLVEWYDAFPELTPAAAAERLAYAERIALHLEKAPATAAEQVQRLQVGPDEALIVQIPPYERAPDANDHEHSVGLSDHYHRLDTLQADVADVANIERDRVLIIDGDAQLTVIGKTSAAALIAAAADDDDLDPDDEQLADEVGRRNWEPGES